MRALWVGSTIVLAASSARADDAGVPDAAPDPAWGVYDDAFVALARRDADAAREALTRVRASWPDHPAAARAGERLAELDAVDADAAPPRTTRAARGELILGMTVNGVLLARDLCVEWCTTDRHWAATMMATGGGALAASVLATRDGVEPGEAQLYNSATTWGTWNALGINEGFAEDGAEAGVAIGAQAAGLFAGIGLRQFIEPSSGDVATANTAFLWTTIFAIYGHLAFEAEPTWRRVVVIGDLGLVAGAMIATQTEMSRGRTMLIDVGGVLGSLAGGLVAANADDEQTAGTALLVGGALGLGAAAYLTRDWDWTPPARVVPTRVADGWGGAVVVDF